jgi:hypothetical protein
MPKSNLSKHDVKSILDRAMGQCECEFDSHDHGIDRCPHKIGTRRKFTYREGSVHNANFLNVIVVCPSCYSLIQSERGKIH